MYKRKMTSILQFFKNLSVLDNLSLDGYKIKCNSDGYICFTELANICTEKSLKHKQIKDWMVNKSTKEFLHGLAQSLNTTPQKLIFYENSRNENRGTYGHPLLLIQFSQWLSVEFGVKVSKWIFELLMYEKVELGSERNFDSMFVDWKDKCKEYENEIEELKSYKDILLSEKDELTVQKERLEKQNIEYDESIKNLQSSLEELYSLNNTLNKNLDSQRKSLERYQKKKRYHKFDNKGPCYYILSDNSLCEKDCKRQDFFKHGIAGNGDNTINKRLQQHRTTLPFLTVDFIVYFREPSIIEKHFSMVYQNHQNPLNHEWFLSNSSDTTNLKDKLIDDVKTYMQTYFSGQYEIVKSSELELYNKSISPLTDETCIEDNLTSEDENDRLESEIEKKVYLTQNICDNDMKNSTFNHCSFGVSAEEFKSIIELLNELKKLTLESLTIKKLDSYMNRLKIAKYGNKEKKIDKLREFMSKLSI